IVKCLLEKEDTKGERIYITGNIYDGNGNTIPDALIELWQADSKGYYRANPINQKNDGFAGFGRLGTGTNPKHKFTFETIKPAAVAAGEAPHINVILFMRGSLHQLYTRMYFADEINNNDPLLNSVEPSRKQTLIAQREEVNGRTIYHFDIHMQGE